MPAALPSQFIPLIGDGHGETRGDRVMINRFGDGYKQRIEDSINTIERKMTLRFFTDVNSPAKPLVLQAFLDERGQSDPISWKAPTDSSPQNWLITSPYERQDLVINKTTYEPIMSIFTVQVEWVPF